MSATLVLALGLVPIIGATLATPHPSGGVLPPTCSSLVYCQGRLLHDVQINNVYQNDSKEFVDMKLKFNESDIISKYEAHLKNEWKGKPNKRQLEEFVENNFAKGNELVRWTPPDFKQRPSLVDRVLDDQFKKWIVFINNVTLNLSRKVIDDVRVNQHRYSLLYVPNGFVIPGGRFRELYYWDTYWIMNGLLLCDMVDTARGVIENLMYLFKTYGIIPNGSRKYYLGRSQPPLLTPMVHDYLNRSSSDKDLKFVKDNLHVLDSEFEFWMLNRSVTVHLKGTNYTMVRYNSRSAGPRPESYREDLNLAKHLKTEQEKNELYSRIKSAAESGMDFSSRWFIAADGSSNGTLKDTDTPDIVPVDLNAFLHHNAKILSGLHARFNNPKKAKYYQDQADNLLRAIDAVLWNKKDGIWYDYDNKNKKPRAEFFASNLFPLWTRSYHKNMKTKVTKSVIRYINREEVKFPGGVPISFHKTGQQWDFPNTWPPVQAMVIQGLERLGTRDASRLARRLARKWLLTIYKNYACTIAMYEKYDVSGQPGKGGEYTLQIGFGWTNGVVLQLLNAYPDHPAEDAFHDHGLRCQT